VAEPAGVPDTPRYPDRSCAPAGSAFWIPYWNSMVDKDEMTASGRSTGTPAEVFMLLADACTALELKAEDRLLEVGCGSGLLSRHLAYHSRWAGTDSNAWILSSWLDRRTGLVGSVWDISKPAPFRAESSDKILVGSVLQYLNAAEVATALKELRRIIKPGGKCFLQSVPDARQLDVYLRGCPSDRHELNLKAQWFDDQQLLNLAIACGWTEAEINRPDPRLWISRYYFDMLLVA